MRRLIARHGVSVLDEIGWLPWDGDAGRFVYPAQCRRNCEAFMTDPALIESCRRQLRARHGADLLCSCAASGGDLHVRGHVGCNFSNEESDVGPEYRKIGDAG